MNNVCQFCGQVLLDNECDCPQSQDERRKVKKIEDAKSRIHLVFVADISEDCIPPSDEVIEILNDCVEQIVRHKLNSITFDLPGGIKAKISKSRKGSIKIERIETIKNSSETQE